MNHIDLADNAILQTKAHEAVLTDRVREKLALAYVAQWIGAQDDSISAEKILRTARMAMSNIHHYFA